MSPPVFKMRKLAFERLPQFGADHVLARLTPESAEDMGFPFFREDRIAHTSDSEFMNFDGYGPVIDAYNPEHPPVPEKARFVITGQQPGLLTGPLYSFLKALTAIRLAERLGRDSETPVLPLFWIASEDHDVLEVNRFHINDQRFVFPYPHEIQRGKVPQVGRIPLDGAREPLLAFLSENLPKTEFSAWVNQVVGEADFSNYATAFHTLMRPLFEKTELRFIDPLALRPLTTPVLARLMEKWPEVVDAFRRGTEIVTNAGFTPPLKQPGAFEIVGENRVPIEFEKDGVVLSQGTMSRGEAAAKMLADPDAFSTGAALRPVVQDAALPVIAYVAGPTELLYLWQIQPIYEVARIRSSLLIPRVTASFLPAKIAKAANKANVPLEELFHAALKPTQWLAERHKNPDVEPIQDKANLLIEEIERVIRTKPVKWLRRSQNNLINETKKIVRRLGEEALEANEADLHRLEKIAESLWPKGRPQERVLSPFQLLNQYGPAFVDEVMTNLDPLAIGHQVVTIGFDAIQIKDPASENSGDGSGKAHDQNT